MSLESQSLSSHEYSLVPSVDFISHTTVYVPRVQFMFPEYSLCPSLRPHSTVYVPRDYSLCPKSTVYFP